MSVRKLVYFQDEKQLEKYEKYARENGFESFSSFVRHCIEYYMNSRDSYKNLLKIVLDNREKLNLIIEKLDNVSVGTQKIFERQEEVFSSLEDIVEEFRRDYSGDEEYEMLERVLNIFAEHYDKWLSFEDLVKMLNIEGDLRSINLLRRIVKTNKIFDEYVMRKGDKFKAREEPKGDLDIGDVRVE